MKNFKKAFTLIELVVVIAVIAVLSALSIVSYVAVTKSAKKSKALQEARQAWTLVAAEYLGGYYQFIDSEEESYGWYYDYKDDVAKYDYEDQYTVTFDGSVYDVKEYQPKEIKQWDSITNSTISFSDIPLNGKPIGLKLSYYDGIFSRGFSWATDHSVTGSKLYVVKGGGAERADFTGAIEINATSDTSRASVITHKAYIENLEPSTVYSYKVGSPSGWEYGVFKTEKSNPDSITALHVSDAQTKMPDLLYCWENTFAQGIETSGKKLDFVLHNGDQFDISTKYFNTDLSVRWSVSIETIKKYLESTPYMTSTGNHEPAGDSTNIFAKNNCINFAGTPARGGYYSYDYNFAHFVVLHSNQASNSSTVTFNEIDDNGTIFNVESSITDQANWLINDLKSARNKGSKWIVVTMHVGTYTTGDHSTDRQVQYLTRSLTPIFSKYHVDLVLQAHDHTYSKTLPYKWDANGYTTIDNDEDVVNLNPLTTTESDKTYDLNPRGTYYVCTGAAGHRYGEYENDAGIFADVDNEGNRIHPTKSYQNAVYKRALGRIAQNNSYTPYSFESAYSNQVYSTGSLATGNVNANMFGILNLTKTTLTYDFYTVRGNEVRLFDALNIMKT